MCCTRAMTTLWWTSTGTSASTARCGTRNTPCRHNFGTASLSWQTRAPTMDSGQNHTHIRSHTSHSQLVLVSSCFPPTPTGSAISWISPQVGLYVSRSIRLLQDGLTAASRTELSPKPTSPWCGTQTHNRVINILYICIFFSFLSFDLKKIKLIQNVLLLRYVAGWKKRDKL